MPNPRYEEIPLSFEKGLVTEIEDSMLENGQAASLLNWEPTPQGSLRARNRWADISTLGLPTNYQVRGWGSIAAPQAPAIVQEAAAGGVESGAEAVDDSKTVTLPGVTAGNILAAVVTTKTTNAISVSGGYTQRVLAAPSYRVGLYTKVATGGLESFTASAAAIVTSRPDGTTSSTWSTNGAATDHECLNDQSDSTFINGVSDTGYGTLQNVSDPGVHTGHIIWVRSSGNSGTGQSTASLYQGDPGGSGTLIASFVLAETGSILTEGYTLTSGEAANITDYNDLYWHLVHGGGTHTREVYEYSFELPGGDAVHHVHLFEMSGLAAEAPTATDSASDVASDTLSAASASPPGIAIVAGMEHVSDDWVDAPGGSGWMTQFDTTESTARSTGASKAFAASPVTDTLDAFSTGLMLGVLAIWNAAPTSSRPSGFYITLAVATSTGYSIYRIPRDEIQTGTWELMDSDTADDTSAFVSMDVSVGTLIWSSISMSTVRSVVIDTLVGADVTALNSKAGRAVVQHKDRVFVAGSEATPSRVYFSGIGTPTTFTTATDYLDIGGDDGEAIETVLSVEGLLLVGKTSRLYLVSGSGIESFFVNELPGGTAATGRPAVRTPYGTIVAGPADIWVVQGGGVDPMSRPLGTDYSLTGLVSAAYAQDTVLISDSGTGTVYRVNLVTGAWSRENTAAGENQVGNLFDLQGRLYYGVLDSTTEVGGTRRLSSARDYDETTGTVAYAASTGKMAMFGPSVKYTPRHLFLQLRSQDTERPAFLTVTITSNQGVESQQIDVDRSPKRTRIDLGKYAGSEWLQISFDAISGSGAAAIDVERVILAVYTEDRR